MTRRRLSAVRLAVGAGAAALIALALAACLDESDIALERRVRELQAGPCPVSLGQ